MATKKRAPTPVPFETHINGKIIHASYVVEKGCITVEYWAPDADRRVATTQLGGHATVPESLARRLLNELVSSSK